MAQRTQRQLMALAALVVVFIAVTFMRGAATPADAPVAESNPVAAGTAGARAQGAAAAAASQTPVDVRLELLREPRGDAGGRERNPFRFREAPPPPPPPRPAAAPPPVPAGPPVPQGPPPPPPITLRLIGLVTAPTQAGRVAVFSDGRGNTFNGREGDIIEGRYRLLKIGADSAELAYTDGRGRQVIRLSGQ